MNGNPAWWALARDIGVTLLAAFILIYLTVSGSQNPFGVYLIGAAVTLIGTPWVLRIREKEKNGNGKVKNGVA